MRKNREPMGTGGGVLSIVLGVCAIVWCIFSNLFTGVIAGIVFIVAGICGIISAKFRSEKPEKADSESMDPAVCERYDQGILPQEDGKQSAQQPPLAGTDLARAALSAAETDDGDFISFVEDVFLRAGYLSLELNEGETEPGLLLLYRGRTATLVKVYRQFTEADWSAVEALLKKAAAYKASCACLVTNWEPPKTLVARAAAQDVAIIGRFSLLEMAQDYVPSMKENVPFAREEKPNVAEAEEDEERAAGRMEIAVRQSVQLSKPACAETAPTAVQTAPDAGGILTLTGGGKTLTAADGILTITDDEGETIRIACADIADVLIQEPGYVLPGYIRFLNTVEAYVSDRRFNEDEAQIPVTGETVAAAHRIREYIQTNKTQQ